MPNTFSQIYLQFVFAVSQRRSLIPKEHKEELHKYITGFVQRRNAKMLAVHCMPDHIHLFVGFQTNYINLGFCERNKSRNQSNLSITKNGLDSKFKWQEGYGVFSYSHSQVDIVVKYVLNQEEHHRTKSFKVEYFEFLKKFNVAFNEKYVVRFHRKITWIIRWLLRSLTDLPNPVLETGCSYGAMIPSPGPNNPIIKNSLKY